jgi:hypothetical protein
LAEKQLDSSFLRNEKRATYFAEEDHRTSYRPPRTAGSISREDRGGTTIEDIANETPNMTTATTTSSRTRPLPTGPSTMPGNGHSAPIVHNGASGPEHQYATPRSRGQRQVGDWILGKTIGAGSMGKVKIVVHQYTKEKVRQVSGTLLRFPNLTLDDLRSARSKSSRGLPLRHARPLANVTKTQTTPPKPPQETHQRKHERSAKRPSPSSSITRTSAACGK